MLKIIKNSVLLGCLMLLPAGFSWAQTISVDVDPNGTGEFYAGGCFDVYVDFTSGGSATSPSFRLQYPDDFTLNANNCTADPTIGRTVSCVDGTVGASAGNRTLSIIYSSTIPVSNVPTHSLGNFQFCVDDPWTGGTLPSQETFSFVDVSSSIASATGADVTITELVAVQNVTPSSLSFNDTPFGDTDTTQTVTISNDGTDGIDMEVTDISLSGTGFSISGGTCSATPFTLSDGSSCTVGISFTPPAVASYTGTLTVTSDAATVTNGSVSLSGEGVAQPNGGLTISPASYDFLTLEANADTETQVFTITSSGQAGSSVSVNTPTLTGSSDFTITNNTCSGSLDAGNTCSVTVQFAPTSVASLSTTLAVTGSDENSAQVSDSVSITGEGVPAPAGGLTIAPDPYDFSTVEANADTATQVFTITSSGQTGSVVTLNTPSLSGSTDFTITADTCSGTLAEGSTCNVTVQFEPTSVAALSTTLSVSGTDENSDPVNDSVNITGEGVPAPAGGLTITPDPYDFGSLLTGEEDSSQVFTVTSSGATGSEILFTEVDVSASVNGLSISANTCTGTLAQGSTCSVTLSFDPTVDSSWAVTLDVAGTDGNDDVKTDSATVTGAAVTEARPTVSPASGHTFVEYVGIDGGSADFDINFGNQGNLPYDVSCGFETGDTSIFSIGPNLGSVTVDAGGSSAVTVSCAVPDTDVYEATLTCFESKGFIEVAPPGELVGTTEVDFPVSYTVRCVGEDPQPIPANNRWGLMLLALMMLTVAGFGWMRRGM